jgi:hypothetical protein
MKRSIVVLAVIMLFSLALYGYSAIPPSPPANLASIVAALGFTPLNPANNLSELSSYPSALSNFGLNSTGIFTATMGIPYTLTTTPAPVTGYSALQVTIPAAGTYLIRPSATIGFTNATFAANQTLTMSLYRTNNTPATITSSSLATTTPVISAMTYTWMVQQLPEIRYTTTNANDVIALYGGISAEPSIGSINVTAASIVVQRVY